MEGMCWSSKHLPTGHRGSCYDTDAIDDTLAVWNVKNSVML